MTCAWCSKPLRIQRGGTFTKRFCGAPCRAALHTAARRWALAALDADLITVQTLRDTEQCQKNRLLSTERRPVAPRQTGRPARPTTAATA